MASVRIIILFSAMSVVGCSDAESAKAQAADVPSVDAAKMDVAKRDDGDAKIAADVERHLTNSGQLENKMYQSCLSAPGMGWDAGAEYKCECVKRKVKPNMTLMFEQAKVEADGSYEKFNAMDWDNLISHGVIRQSFKDCGFKY